MIETLEYWDRLIVQTINGWNTPFMDELMWVVSAKITWIPLYLFIIYLAYRSLGLRKSLIFLLVAILAVVLSDTISVHLFKNVFQRYRPSHNEHLKDILHFYEIKKGEFYRGGEFGFVSSHATNFFALATFVSLTLNKIYPKLKWWLLFFGVLIVYSRIYLGVHYLSDVTVGALIGMLIAFVLYKRVYCPIIHKMNSH